MRQYGSGNNSSFFRTIKLQSLPPFSKKNVWMNRKKLRLAEKFEISLVNSVLNTISPMHKVFSVLTRGTQSKSVVSKWIIILPAQESRIQVTKVHDDHVARPRVLDQWLSGHCRGCVGLWCQYLQRGCLVEPSLNTAQINIYSPWIHSWLRYGSVCDSTHGHSSRPCPTWQSCPRAALSKTSDMSLATTSDRSLAMTSADRCPSWRSLDRHLLWQCPQRLLWTWWTQNGTWLFLFFALFLRTGGHLRCRGWSGPLLPCCCCCGGYFPPRPWPIGAEKSAHSQIQYKEFSSTKSRTQTHKHSLSGKNSFRPSWVYISGFLFHSFLIITFGYCFLTLHTISSIT